jgi:hypothetical protein
VACPTLYLYIWGLPRFASYLYIKGVILMKKVYYAYYDWYSGLLREDGVKGIYELCTSRSIYSVGYDLKIFVSTKKVKWPEQVHTDKKLRKLGVNLLYDHEEGFSLKVSQLKQVIDGIDDKRKNDLLLSLVEVIFDVESMDDIDRFDEIIETIGNITGINEFSVILV